MRIVSDKKWQDLSNSIGALERRIAALENKDPPRAEPPTIRQGYIPGSVLRPYHKYEFEIEITHEALLLKILSHLGLSLRGIPEQPKTVELVKAAKK